MWRPVASRCVRRASNGNGPGAYAEGLVPPEGTVTDLNRVDFGKVRVDVVHREELVAALAKEQREWFKKNKPQYFNDTTLENPKNIREWIAKKMVTFEYGRKRFTYRKYGDRMAITMLNHVNNPDWCTLFGIKESYLDVVMWLMSIHMWMVQKRMFVVPESRIIGDAILRMYESSADQRLNNLVATNREKSTIMERFNSIYMRNLVALDEAFHPDIEYNDAMIIYALFRNSPFEHREEVPMFAWYTLLQYIRLHLAVFDQIPNDEIKQGFLYFYHPLDTDLFEPPEALDSPKYVAQLIRGKRGAKMPSQVSATAAATTDASSASASTAAKA